MTQKVGVLLKAGPRWPAAHGPGARWPTPDFPQFFGPEGNPRACTDLHRVWACKMDDGEFEFVYHFNNHFNPFRSFLSLHVAKWKTLSFSVYSLFICLFIGPFCTPKPDADLCMRVDLPLNKKIVENHDQDWATGPPGCRAFGPLGVRATRPLGCCGPWVCFLQNPKSSDRMLNEIATRDHLPLPNCNRDGKAKNG